MILAGGGCLNGVVQAIALSTIREPTAKARSLLKLQHRHERLLWDLDRSNSLHPSLAFFLLLLQFAFPGHVTAIALGQHVLSHRGNRLAGDDLAADRGLNRDLVELARDDRLQLLDQAPALLLRLAAVRDQRERV